MACESGLLEFSYASARSQCLFFRGYRGYEGEGGGEGKVGREEEGGKGRKRRAKRAQKLAGRGRRRGRGRGREREEGKARKGSKKVENTVQSTDYLQERSTRPVLWGKSAPGKEALGFWRNLTTQGGAGGRRGECTL